MSRRLKFAASGVLCCASLALSMTLCWAGGAARTGMLISENTVPCGSKARGKKKTAELDCQEYVIRTATTDYRVRQPKPTDKALLAINTGVEFTIDKNKMKFKANGHTYEYLIVGEAPAGSGRP